MHSVFACLVCGGDTWSECCRLWAKFIDISKSNSKDIPDWYFVDIIQLLACMQHIAIMRWNFGFQDCHKIHLTMPYSMAQQSWCMFTNKSTMVTRVTMISVSRMMNQRWEGRAPHNFHFDNVFTRNMKFSILTLILLNGTASAVLGQEVSSIRGRKATQGCVPCSLEVCTSDLNACPDTNPFVCLDGKDKSWCTAIGSIWLNAEGCHECRGLSHCSEEEPKEEPKSCCGPCSDLNACPDTNPFACLNNKAKSGCTAIEHIWLNPEACHECCDLAPFALSWGGPGTSKVDPPTDAPTKYYPPR
jgi:hypothetical protein